AFQHDDAVFESYRIPQLMVPWRSWAEIWLDYERYSREKFYNEVLGLSYDSGMRPLTTAQIKAHCNERVSMAREVLEPYRKAHLGTNVFAGIDWGTGENSYTVLSLGHYVCSKFRIFFIHRFTGEDTDPELQLKKIVEILIAFNAKVIGADYGGGN